MADQTLTVRIVGDEKDYIRALRTSAGATQRFTASFGTFVKGTLVFEGVRAGVQALTNTVRSGIDEFSEMQKVQAQTQAALKSTGGVAGVTARDVEALAGRLSSLSGIDDEIIQSSQNLLLTFTNIRNEVGKGNNVFDRAAQAVLDLNVRGFGPLDSVAKQVGKALQDPVKGLTSLSRAGVQFTNAQRETIKGFVETGRVAEAHKVILREIERQVGGSAKALGETLPGQLNKLREAFRNAFGNLVGAVAGPLSRVAGEFAAFIPRIEEGVARISATVGPALTRVVEAFSARLPELQRIAASILDPLRQHVLPILREFAETARGVFDAVVAVFSNRSGELRQILDNLGGVLANVWTIARPTIVFLFEKVLPAALNIAIPIIEKLTGITKTMSDIFVRSVSVIVKALDVFLGALSRVADAASHLPFVGDQFAGVADKVNASRESLREFSASLDAIAGRKVSVSIAVDVTTGRREEGALGRSSDGVKKATEEATKQATADLEAQKGAARDLSQSASAATTETKKAKTAAEKQREAFDALMATIGLRRDRAAATAGLKDDIAQAVAAKKALEEQLKIQKGNVQLQRELQQANQDLVALRAQQRQGRQFEALGLTAEGQKRVPGVGALRNRLANLREQIKGTALDTSKTRSQLAQIAKVLSGQFGAVGKDVRAAILAMFNDIAGALDSGGKQGPLTKTSGLNTKKILAGLGLDPEQIRELRGRLSGFNTGGLALAAAGPTVGATAGGFVGAAPIVVESHTTINLDGQKVATVVTKAQQKAKRRNPRQKRGPNRNR